MSKVPSTAELPQVLQSLALRVKKLEMSSRLSAASIGSGGLSFYGGGGIRIEDGGSIRVADGGSISATGADGSRSVLGGSGFASDAADGSEARLYGGGLNLSPAGSSAVARLGAAVDGGTAVTRLTAPGASSTLMYLQAGNTGAAGFQVFGDNPVRCDRGTARVSLGDDGWEVTIPAGASFRSNAAQWLMYNLPTSSYPANLYITGARVYVGSGSIRALKHDIEPWDVDTDELLSLQPQTWIDKAERDANDELGIETTRRVPGLVAEEVAERESLEPLLTHDDDGELSGLAYDRVAVALLPIVAQLREENTALREQVSALSARLDDLESRD